MDFRDTPEEATFRQEVREFVHSNLPTDRAGTLNLLLGDVGPLQDWFAKLAEIGWLTASWPREYGGAGLSPMQQFVLNEEFALARIPRPLHMIIGLGIAGPTLIGVGTEEQKRRYLPGMISGKEIWCQGFSEPEAGSDVASLQTRAVRDGDDYIINGHKMWTTAASFANWCILLARTDPDAPKHKGLTYFIVDMEAPGVSVRPITDMTGGQGFNEMFFDNVRVPKENIIGEENRGWYAAVYSLDQERSAIGNSIGMIQTVTDLVSSAHEHANDHTSALETNQLLRLELVDRRVEAEVARLLSYRIVTMQVRGEATTKEASASKLYTTELNQRIARTGLKVFGLYGQLMPGSVWAPRNGSWAYTYVRSPAYTIEGGTSEVQRNIIGQRGLGLPRSY